MDEVETVERMSLVLDPAEHMRAANPACMALDRRRRIDHMELVTVLQNGDVFARHDRNHGEGRSLRLPAFRTTAGVVVGDVALYADLDWPVLAFADQGSRGKIA